MVNRFSPKSFAYLVAFAAFVFTTSSGAYGAPSHAKRVIHRRNIPKGTSLQTFNGSVSGSGNGSLYIGVTAALSKDATSQQRDAKAQARAGTPHPKPRRFMAIPR
jgi:hypothetical protein